MFRFCVLGVVAIIGFGGVISPVLAEKNSQGKTEYLNYCAQCHGITGQGDGPVALELKNPPTDLTLLAQKNGGVFDRVLITKKVDGRSMPRSHGTAQMPVWGQWFELHAKARGVLQDDRQGIESQVQKRLKNLVDFLSSIQRK